MRRILAPAGFTLILSIALALGPGAARADITIFDSSDYATSAVVRDNWLVAVGGIGPAYLVDFESGFTNGQNISGTSGLFPGGLVITDTGSLGQAVVRSGAGSVGGSNPVDIYALTQNEAAYLELDFSANPIGYLALRDIDHTGTRFILTFVGGGTTAFDIDGTGSSGNTAEFLGIIINDMPRITRVQMDASGDARWGVDDIAYGPAAADVPEPGALASVLGAGMASLALVRRRRRCKLG